MKNRDKIINYRLTYNLHKLKEGDDMWQAALWGAIAGSSVFIGALLGIKFEIKRQVTGYIMAIGTGVLIGAASFELLTESVKNGGLLITAVSFLVGAIIFTVINFAIAYRGGHERKKAVKGQNNGLAIFIGTIMDAIPESLIIGSSLAKDNHISWLLVVAVFISNLPEGLSSSVGLKKGGYSSKQILLLWIIVVILALMSSLVGYIFLNNTSAQFIAIISALAAGAIVAMVSATMMPEAYENSGPLVGLLTACGLIISVILTYF